MAAPRLDFATPHLLRNAREYRAAVAEVDALLDRDPRRGTAAFDRLEFLSVLVEAFEEERYPMPRVTPQQSVTFMLEQRGLTRAVLASAMGGRSRVSEFFRGKRRLSLGQVRALTWLLGVPADLLIG